MEVVKIAFRHKVADLFGGDVFVCVEHEYYIVVSLKLDDLLG